MGKYILENGTPVKCDFLTWSNFFGDTDSRRVAVTFIDDIKISTVFLGVAINFNKHAQPLLFETLIFPSTGASGCTGIDAFDHYEERHATLKEAQYGHVFAVRYVIKELECVN